MNLEAIKSAYRRYARIYDAVFGPIFHPGRKLIVKSLGLQPGDQVLEVGVGTGLSLPLYPNNVKVTGIDVSREMLDKARLRSEHAGLKQVEALLEMDGEEMRFADNTFDKVVAMYVVTVVPNPLQLVEEMRRVCKPGGEIFIVNHFRSQHPLIGVSEALLSPLSKLAGFRTDMELDQFLKDAQLDVVETRNTNLFGYWKVLRYRNPEEKEAMVA